ncbi:hydrogenase 2 accessory protein HypG [Symmachiella macrocystis]|uniref:Hydrogenase 2 accessory protein HypG n=1 Tax=Symmachiella macrocystis TaxID=2527985 RepID=A0A5C6BEC4_9PLAN|nr:HypC/HybG/HupF family hydrogenase formation chaperone [Symmachiella macrocystis]TWU08804.1 hydrogenase 2 accessory protein HypG [Symmachiella macrocystis]
MCLGVPGLIIRWIDRDPTFGKAEVEFEGIRRVCHMACVPEAEEGDYVVVHAGIAISRVDAREAQQLIAELKRLGLPDEFSETTDSLPPISKRDSP